jgi:DNA-binding NtrC family response regulator
MENLPENSPILVVDDDEGLLLSLRAALLSSGLPDPAMVSDARRVESLVEDNQFQLAMIDLIMPNLDGLAVLRQIKQKSPLTECIIVTAVDDVSSAVEAMRFGAYDYLVKPLNLKRVTIAVNNALERYKLHQGIALFEKPKSFADLKQPKAFSKIIAKDNAMAMVFHQAEVCAQSDLNIMITGETGVGKGMLARAIHKLSPRSSSPFVAVNMSTFSHSLFEDNFFGHIRGAFTGADSDRRGFVEAAQGGTLFLDEITELEPAAQAKILRVIEEKEFYRLGSTEIRSADLRILSASNRDINESVAAGRLRGDLYFRLNEYHIHIPPLRRRPKDIIALAMFFLEKHARKNAKKIHRISQDTVKLLTRYPFRGNVRELENIIASSVLAETSDELSVSSVQLLIKDTSESTIPSTRFPKLAEIEKQHIIKALQHTQGNRTHAAKLLGIGLRTLQRKIKNMKIN